MDRDEVIETEMQTEGGSSNRPVSVVIVDQKKARTKEENIAESISRWSTGNRRSLNDGRDGKGRGRLKSDADTIGMYDSAEERSPESRQHRSGGDGNSGEDGTKTRIGTDAETIRARDVQCLRSRGLDWTPDEEAENCADCNATFSVVWRRHHCRICGKVFCRSCCFNRASFPHILSHNYSVRVCRKCYNTDVLDAHTGTVNSITTLQSGEVISVSDDGTFRVWEIMWTVDSSSGGSCIATARGHSGPVTGIYQAPDGRIVTVSEDKTLRIWRGSSPLQGGGFEISQLGIMQGAAAARCVVGRENQLFCGGQDGMIYVWRLSAHDVGHADCIAKYTGHERPVRCLAFTLEGGRLLSGSEDNTVRVWNTESEACLGMIASNSSVNSIAPIPGSHGCIVAAAGDGTLRIWKVTVSHKEKAMLEHKFLASLKGHERAVLSVAIVKELYIASGGADNTVLLWSLETGKVVARLHGHTAPIHAVVPMPSGLILTGSADSSLRIWRYTPPEKPSKD